MNRSFLCALLFLLAGTAVMAQNSAVTNAILYHKDGDLANAKKEIDKAVVHEKTKADPKAWYYKGVICTDIARSENAGVKSLSAEPLKEAVDALYQARQLDPAKGEYYKLSTRKLEEIWPEIVNKGIAEYEAEKIRESLSWFETAQQIRPEDTVAFVYGSYAAEALSDNATLKKYTEKLIALNHKSPYVYRNWITTEQDPARKLEIAQKATADFPNDEVLTETVGDLYASQGKSKEAIEAYQKLNGWLPNNQTILLKIALQYQKAKDGDKALEYYEQVVKLNNPNFLAHYNAAVIYFDKGKNLNDAVHKMNVSEYQQKGKALEDEMKKNFNAALTHANAAQQLTKDQDDLNNLKLMVTEINKVVKN